MSDLAPVQLLAVGFGPDANFEGRIMAELTELEQAGTVRILDLLFVAKEEDGSLVALDYQGESLGAIVGALLGFDFEGDVVTAEPEAAIAGGRAFGLSLEHVEGLAASLPAGHSAGVLLVEHVWARKFKNAVRDAGGVPLGEGFLTPEAVAFVAAELVAMSEELDKSGEGDGLMAAAAANRVRTRQQCRTMSRMQRRRSAI
jgi:Family of unknown function (DUF6325)